MKAPPLTIIEHHPSGTSLPEKTIHQTITTWLTKELHKGCLCCFIGKGI